MKKQQDMVLMPNEWLPMNVISLVNESNPLGDPNGQVRFYTDDLNKDGEVFYINKDGYLIHENISMRVVSGIKEVNRGGIALVVDTSHEPVLGHRLKKLYSHITNKICILVLQFKQDKVIEVQSIIRSCTQ